MDSTSPELPPYAMPVDFSSMVGTIPYDIIAAQFTSRIVCLQPTGQHK